MAKEKTEKPAEPIEEVVVKKQHDDFLTRKLKAVNNMTKPAKAERSASRLLRKARNK